MKYAGLSTAAIEGKLKKSGIPYFIKDDEIYCSIGRDPFKKHILLRDILRESVEVPGYVVLVDSGIMLREIGNGHTCIPILHERDIASPLNINEYIIRIRKTTEEIKLNHPELFSQPIETDLCCSL